MNISTINDTEYRTYENNIHKPMPYTPRQTSIILAKNPGSLDRKKTTL